MIKNAQFQNKELTIETDKSVSLVHMGAQIAEVIKLDDRVIVLTKPSADIGDKNIFCFDQSGEKIWAIQEPDRVYEHNPFMEISLRGDGYLLAGCWNSTTYIVDIYNGKFVSKYYDK